MEEMKHRQVARGGNCMKKTLEILTPEKALLNIKNTAISTRVGDWGMESTYVKDLSSTQQPFAVLDLALTELAEIKQRAEEMKSFIKSTVVTSNLVRDKLELSYEKAEQDIKSRELELKLSLIDYILKGEKK